MIKGKLYHLAMLLLALFATPVNAQPDSAELTPIVTNSGRVSGFQLDPEVNAWLGIPFAAPPVGPLRWRAPASPKPWKGVLHADRRMPQCMQMLRAHATNHYFGEEATSEDCLYLNVWAPVNRKQAKLPVIVFFYGGAFVIGSSGSPMYAGNEVARAGAIFVNFNYRLGILGFMAHPALTAESATSGSGNYGMMDQIAALRWVKENIAAFGGDPDKVTIAGQSAGAMSVAMLQASPAAKGLFSNIVAMSGFTWVSGGTAVESLQDGEKIGLKVQAALKAKSIEEMRNVAADRLLLLQKDRYCQVVCTTGDIAVNPVVDGHILPATPAQLFASGQQSDVPVLAGFAHDESATPLSKAKTVDEFQTIARSMFGAKADMFLKLYPVRSDEEVGKQAAEVARTGNLEREVRNWAIAQSEHGTVPVYLFDFARVHPFIPGVAIADNPQLQGAYHNSDVPYWLGTLDVFNEQRATRHWTKEDRALSQAMTATLLNFARNGKPSGSAVRWPKWSINDEAIMTLDIAPVFKVRQLRSDRAAFHRETPVIPPQTTLPASTRD